MTVNHSSPTPTVSLMRETLLRCFLSPFALCSPGASVAAAHRSFALAGQFAIGGVT